MASKSGVRLDPEYWLLSPGVHNAFWCTQDSVISKHSWETVWDNGDRRGTSIDMCASLKCTTSGKKYIFLSMNYCVTPRELNLFGRRKKLWYQRQEFSISIDFLIHVLNDTVLTYLALPSSERWPSSCSKHATYCRKDIVGETAIQKDKWTNQLFPCKLMCQKITCFLWTVLLQ